MARFVNSDCQKHVGGNKTKLRVKMLSVVVLLAAFAVIMPSTANLAYPDKNKDCSGCHGPSSGTYYESIMSITVSKTTLAPGEAYTLGIDIVIQTQLTKKQTGYSIQDLTSSAWVASGGPADQSHYDQAMTAPSASGTYSYRVWGESGPATADGKSDYDDFTITVQQAQNRPPTVTPLANITGKVGVAITFTATASDPDMDTLKYTWNFGDSTPLIFGNPVQHTFTSAGTFNYSVFVDDGHQHNVTRSAKAIIAAAVNFGLLRVTTNPAVPTMISINGEWASPWGLNWVKLSPGTYSLTFSDVPGFVTHQPASVTITAGQTTNYDAIFAKTGSLRVITSPAVPSTIYVNGIPRNDWGIWVDIPAGTYTVSFGLVKDYSHPADQIVTLVAGGYQEVTGVFNPSPGAPGPDATLGLLRVTTTPAVPTMVKIDGQWASPWGLNWVKLSPGAHVLSFTGVPGFITPVNKSITIVSGQTTTVDVNFGPTGSLRVITSPAVPSTIYVNGIPRNDWGLWADISPGTYVVTFGDVPGYNKPTGQTVTLVAGGYQEVTGVFTLVP